MRRIISALLVLTAVAYLSSCARGISPYEAANGKAKCGRYLR
jgi:Prokaryotic membrane lipoprotein lipid attachment site